MRQIAFRHATHWGSRLRSCLTSVARARDARGVDLTTVLAAAVAGASGITGGYAAARQQAATTRLQERSRRRDVLHDERVKTYHDLLDTERRLRRLIASGEPVESDQYATWWGELEDLVHLVILTGTPEVRARAEQLEALYGQLDVDRRRQNPHGFTEGVVAAFTRHEPEIERLRKDLIAAMRDDVAPAAETPPRQAAASVDRAKPELVAAARQLAAVSISSTVSEEALRRVASAVQRQIERDFAPRWGLTATIEVYDSFEAIPPDAWRVTVADDIGVPGMASYHTDVDGDPFVMVAAMGDWSQYFSHDCLEMLASPLNDDFVDAASPKADQGRVKILKQICDPCAAPECGYVIDGVRVADFCTPDYFEVASAARVRYDHADMITRPLQVLPGGYVTWFEPASRRLWRFMPNSQPEYEDLGEFPGLSAVVSAVKITPEIGFYGASD